MNVTQSVDQMNNIMQNVLLQELENFTGILIATTNLLHNLDTAFERRFLFKIKFGKPSVEARSLIWKTKVEWLNDEQSKQLANKYEFSGGQIDNIAKKLLMNSLLCETGVSFETLIEFCDSELFVKTKENRSIGFIRSN